jgi:hypothetical protein
VLDFLRGHSSVARSIVTIQLEAMTEREIKEIFYIANAIAADVLYFDPTSIDRIYRLSGGLPYFAQLFGYLLVLDLQADKSFAEFIKQRREYGPIVISDHQVDEVAARLPTVLTQYADCVKDLVGRSTWANDVLKALGVNKYLSMGSISEHAGTTISQSLFEEWLEGNPLAQASIRVRNNKIHMVDPILRQYILITESSDRLH